MGVTQVVIVRQRHGRQRNCLALGIHPARGDVHTWQEIRVAPKQIVGRAIFLEDHDHIQRIAMMSWSLGMCNRGTK